MKITESLVQRYRPKTLDEFIGHYQVVKQLKGMFVNRRIVRSMLIYGNTGEGKTTIARMIGRYVNCQNLSESGELCLKCDSCKAVVHPDIHEMNAASDRGIDQIRKLEAQSKYMPRFNFRVFILDELHQCTPQALQAFLKPLEEPPAKSIWILATTNPEKLPDTILGRCLKLPLTHVPKEDLEKYLLNIAEKEKVKVPKKIISKIVAITNGQPRNSLQALESVINLILAGEKDFDIENVVSQLLGLANKSHVYKYLLSVYLKKFTGAFRVIEDITNYEPFLKQVMFYHVKALYHLTSADKLDEKWCHDWYSLLDKHSIKLPAAAMGRMMLSMTHSFSEMKTYLVDSKLLMVALTTQLIANARGLK